MPIKPERLNEGDLIGIVTPASPPPDPAAYERSIAALQRLGFKARLAPNARKRRGFLAGTDRERAADVMSMFVDRRVKAIFSLRGGYGAGRILSLLDYAVIRAHPKIFVGYSDITSLHCAFLTVAGLVSFHGPMLNSDLIKERVPDYTMRGFLRTLMEAAAPGSLRTGYEGKSVRVIRSGIASGPLVGGNLTLLCATLGTRWQPSFRNRILFFEELQEPPYRVDRMLTHLLNAGVLQQVAGVAIGINTKCEDPRAETAKEYRQSLEDVLRERLLPLKVPVIAGLPFGHTPFNATLPIGIRARLDGDTGDLTITEAAVS